MKTFNSFPINGIAIQELADITLPALTDYLNIGKSTDILGKRITINDLAQLISSALGSGTILPERRYVTGSAMPSGATYVVNGTNGAGQINDPYLDGKIFDLHRNGFLIAKGIAWQNDVAGGGFRSLVSSDIFGDAEEFIASFQPQFSPYIPSPDAIARFSNGEALYSGAINTLGAGDFRKIIQLAASGTTIKLNLPPSASYPQNVMLCIVSEGGGHKQATLSCSSGEYIIFSGGGYADFWLGQGSQIILIPNAIGWRIIQWSESDHFQKMGMVNTGYLAGPNQWLAVANPAADVPQLRSVYPRVWDFIIKLMGTQPDAVVSGAAWATKRQMWGTGDGSTTFNFPDLSGTFARFADPYGQYDFDRYGNGTTTNVANLPGNFWTFAMPKHKHAYVGPGFGSGTANFVGGGTFNPGVVQLTDEQGTSIEGKPVSTLFLPLINI